MDTNSALNKIDENKNLIQKLRPLTADQARRVAEYYRIHLTFTSNSLEGNSLTLNETKVLLEKGLTACGKPIAHALEAIGHADAYDLMLKIANQNSFDNLLDILLQLHYLFYSKIDLLNAGKYRQDNVYISGFDIKLPDYKLVTELMLNFKIDFLKIKNLWHPIILASYAHRRLVEIHPFIDGNGRISRLLMNLILINHGYQIISIPTQRRKEYILSLNNSCRKATKNYDLMISYTSFDNFLIEMELAAQKNYMRLLGIDPKNPVTPDPENSGPRP